MLAEAGVEPPRTMAELADAAARLTQGRRKGLYLGNDGGVAVLGGPLLWSAGLDFVTEDHRPGIADPAVLPAMRAMRALFTSGHLLLGAPTDWSDPAAFTSGLCAMQWSGIWSMSAVRKALGDDFGVVPWPRFADSAPPSVPVGAYGSMISSKSVVIPQAKEFVRWLWLQRPDLQREFTRRLWAASAGAAERCRLTASPNHWPRG